MARKLITLNDIVVAGKTVLLRVDYNVPMENGRVTDDTRIAESMPTVRYLADNGANVILLSHLGRPSEYQGNRSDLSMKNLESHVKRMLKRSGAMEGHDFYLLGDCIGNVERRSSQPRRFIALAENTRFHESEERNDPYFAMQLAVQGDVYVNDAFASAQNEHASTVGVARYFIETGQPVAAGLLMEREVGSLGKILSPAGFSVAVFGGSKVREKIGVIKSLVEKYDSILVGGRIASTFLKAAGYGIGSSKCDEEFLDDARNLLGSNRILIPRDVKASNEQMSDIRTLNFLYSAGIPDDMRISDIGEWSAKKFRENILRGNCVLWNGPVGHFEIDDFSHGTRNVASAMAKATGNGSYTVAGGGETIAALKRYGFYDKISYVSTGGSAMLKFLENGTLPAIELLYEDD